MKTRDIIREEIEKLMLEKKSKSSKKSKKDGKPKDDKKSDGKKKKNDSGVRKNAIKAKNGKRKSFNYDTYNKDNPNSNYSDNKQLANLLKNPAINVAAIGKMVYPDHTPEGAQSQLRKKIEGEKSDSGKEYRFRRKEIHKLNRVLNQLGLR